MRKPIAFDCGGDRLFGTLDTASGNTGLMIVSGGNEIRCGTYGGQSAMAATFAALGYPVFRYDRRGIGESEGTNGGFESSAEDISAAVSAFRSAAANVGKIIAFGNCDAASALALYSADLGIDMLVLANPWVTEAQQDIVTETHAPPAALPNAAAIRARYLARLKNPRSLIDLLTGKINLRKLASGIAKAAAADKVSGLAARIAHALAAAPMPVQILIAERDNTALAFLAAWQSDVFAGLRTSHRITLLKTSSSSHSFADAPSNAWLQQQLLTALKSNE